MAELANPDFVIDLTTIDRYGLQQHTYFGRINDIYYRERTTGLPTTALRNHAERIEIMINNENYDFVRPEDIYRMYEALSSLTEQHQFASVEEFRARLIIMANDWVDETGPPAKKKGGKTQRSRRNRRSRKIRRKRQSK
jgi:hypothetical protein